jgi:small conductance mechanosensitive channel
VVIGLALFFALRRWTEQMIRKVVPEQFHEQLEGCRKIITWVVVSIGGVLIALGVVAVTVSILGIDITPNLMVVGGWLLGHGLRILIIIGIAYLLHRLAKVLTPRLIERSITMKGKGRRAREELKKRCQTLSHLLTQVIAGVIALIAIFMILSEIEIDITAALAGLGIVGIAVGFGAQYLVRDLIAGFFIFLENQYNVGDVIRVGNIAGGVEEISLRRTILRDLDGARHIIPNGEIRTVSNLTQEWSRAHLNISVAYKENLDQVMALMRKTWEEMTQDPDWSPHMLAKTPWLLRVDEFGDSGITIKMVGETKPIKQWDVMGEFRRRIKKVFDQEGIEIPWPHIKLYMGNTSPKEEKKSN